MLSKDKKKLGTPLVLFAQPALVDNDKYSGENVLTAVLLVKKKEGI